MVCVWSIKASTHVLQWQKWNQTKRRCLLSGKWKNEDVMFLFFIYKFPYIVAHSAHASLSINKLKLGVKAKGISLLLLWSVFDKTRFLRGFQNLLPQIFTLHFNSCCKSWNWVRWNDGGKWDSTLLLMMLNITILNALHEHSDSPNAKVTVGLPVIFSYLLIYFYRLLRKSM